MNDAERTTKPLTWKLRAGNAPIDIDAYEASGGYGPLRKALRMAPADVTAAVTESKLRGRGGAGFPTGQKWSFMPMGDDAPHPKYLICNADEMEPGTFKDRLLLEGDPHQLLEGMIISAWAVQADISYIFLRWAYKLAGRRLEEAIAAAYA
ncbi:MAG: NADH-quinone oxidoreductase subunit F, partial [Caldimonas sp.]